MAIKLNIFRFFALAPFETIWTEINAENFDITESFDTKIFTLDVIEPKSKITGENVYIKAGWKIAITDQKLTDLIAVGMVNSDNPEILTYDFESSTSILKYSLSCIEDEINGIDVIDRENYDTSMFFTEILDDLIQFPYSAEDLGIDNEIIYKINFPDFLIDSASFEDQTLTQAISTLCGQNAIRFTIAYKIIPDEVTVFKYYRYLEFFNREGLDIEGNFLTTINDDTVKFGSNSQYFNLNAENYKIPSNLESIVNSISLSGNLYANQTGDILDRCEIPAQSGKFDYRLDIIAGDIYSVATLITAIILVDSTDTIIKISDADAVNIQIGNEVLILPFGANKEQVNKNAFRKIINFSSASGITDIILNEALSFIPDSTSSFEITNNHVIYEENEENLPVTGVIKRVSRDKPAEIKFLKLSEPHEPQIIIVYASRIIADSLKNRNIQSIKEHKLKYITIKLPDDLILTSQQFSELSNQLLILTADYELRITIYSYYRVKIGSKIIIDIKNYRNLNLICVENNYRNSGALDNNFNSMFIQTIKYSTLNKSTDEIINNYRKSIKKANRTRFIKNLYSQEETITIQDIVKWGKEDWIETPVLTSLALESGGTALRITWEAVNPTGFEKFIIRIGANELYTQYIELDVFNSSATELLVTHPFISEKSEFFVIIRLKTNLGLSALSNELHIEKISNQIIMPSGKSAGLLWNSESMIGSGSLINDLANDNDGILSNSTSWVSDAEWGYGLNMKLANIAIPHNNNFKSSGSSAKFAILYVFSINQALQNNEARLIYNTQPSTSAYNAEVNIFVYTNNIGQIKLIASIGDNNAGSYPNVLSFETDFFAPPALNVGFGLAFYWDLSTNTIKFILNQTELSISLSTGWSGFYSSIDSFKIAGGLANYNSPVVLNQNTLFLGINFEATLWRMMIAKDANTPTPTEIKAIFQNMGLT